MQSLAGPHSATDSHTAGPACGGRGWTIAVSIGVVSLSYGPAACLPTDRVFTEATSSTTQTPTAFFHQFATYHSPGEHTVPADNRL